MDQLEVNNLSLRDLCGSVRSRVVGGSRGTDYARQHRVAVLRLRQSQQVFRSFGKQHSTRGYIQVERRFSQGLVLRLTIPTENRSTMRPIQVLMFEC